METISQLAQGFSVALTYQNLILALAGCFIGTLIGALPGLGPANGVAILIPISFSLGLDATPALILLTSVYYGAMYGGRVSSILLNIPGDEPAMMTTLDGYPMAKKGRAGEALVLSGVASFVGSILSLIGLVVLSPILINIALLFGPAEYFALYAVAFLMLAGFAKDNKSKTAIAALFGIAIAMIGMDGNSGAARFTFGNLHLLDGIDFLVAIVGLFAIAEVFIYMEKRDSADHISAKINKITIPFKTLANTFFSMLRGSLIGFVAGVLPGAGASLGSFLAYTVEKNVSNKNNTFGTGDPRGLAAPEAGNNASAGGALVPLLTLGVPGSGTTAVLLALLITLDIAPGPLLFVERPDVVWGLIAALFIANFMLLILNIPLVSIFAKVLDVPPYVLLPMVVMISFVGIYSISGSTFDLMLMIGFGVIGYVFRKLDVPTVPVILGMLLGGAMENKFRQALTISNGEWSIFLSSGLSLSLWALAAIGYFFPIILRLFNKQLKV